jgi:hypothetical protein
VFRLRELGATHRAITAKTGVSASIIKRWLGTGDEALLADRRRGVHCGGLGNCALVRDAPHDAYAYLLGQYLGDGHIVYAHRGVYRLSIYFPQHGSGPKHRRPIVFQPWQEEIALGEHPEPFVRGLIHSDGWRGTCQWPVSSARWRTLVLPGRGQQNCPATARSSARRVMKPVASPPCRRWLG